MRYLNKKINRVVINLFMSSFSLCLVRFFIFIAYIVFSSSLVFLRHSRAMFTSAAAAVETQQHHHHRREH